MADALGLNPSVFGRAGSTPVSCTGWNKEHQAVSVEWWRRQPFKLEVAGSVPAHGAALVSRCS